MSSEGPRVKVAYGYKVNMGNYETYDVAFEITDSVKEGEKVDDTKNRLDAKVSEWLWKEVEAARETAEKARKTRKTS